MNRVENIAQDSVFQEWIGEKDLGDKEKTILSFHNWMRENTTLNSGTIVDYRKYVAEMLHEYGEAGLKQYETGSSHKQAALNKFREYQESRDNAKESGESK